MATSLFDIKGFGDGGGAVEGYDVLGLDLLSNASAEKGLTLTSFFRNEKSSEGGVALRALSFFKLMPLPLAEGVTGKGLLVPVLLVKSKAPPSLELDVLSFALAKSAYGLVYMFEV